MSMSTWSQLCAARLVPVVVIDDADTAPALADALVAGGLPRAQVTFRTSAAPDALRALADRDDLIVGAGTVLTAAQVDTAVKAGAQYVDSPGLSRAVVERCQEHSVHALRSAMTATEGQQPPESWLNAVKFFTAGTSGGAPAIKALSAPFTNLEFVPTCGNGPNNLH